MRLSGGRDRAKALRTRLMCCKKHQDGHCGYSGEDKGTVAGDVFREAAMGSGLVESASFCKERSYWRVLSQGVLERGDESESGETNYEGSHCS